MTTALVTGCSTGIGYATALRLARDGHHVVATMRTPDGSDLAEKAAAEGLSVALAALDVCSPEVEAVIDDVVATHGEIDILVNNAGIGKGGVVEETDLDVYREVMETNFFGALRCTKAVLPSMRARGGGAIVNVTSQAGVMDIPSMSAYTASKHALEAAAASLAVEVAAFGIRVANIEPGAIMTAIWTKVDTTPPTGPYRAIRERLGQTVMADVARASSAEEVADCISTAITTDAPRLRWLVGQGAQRNYDTQRAITPEDLIAAWNHPDDAEFARLMRIHD